MSEPAWLALNRLHPLMGLAFYHPSATDRRRTLFACACCRCAHDWVLPDLEGDAIDATERYLDGEISRRTWRQRFGPLESSDQTWSRAANQWERDFRGAVAALVEEPGRVPGELLYAVERVSSPEYSEAFEVRLCSVLRDIFGNPFRPVHFVSEWRTDTAVALARQVYESRDFGAMPILADALQDAGCDSADILDHCRHASPAHVRGCWAVDLVLGKV